MAFFDRATGKPATSSQIAKDYRRVSNAAGPGHNYGAGYFRRFTQLEISRETADALMYQVLDEKVSGLKTAFPDFETYPEEAQMALVDMAYNLGVQGIVTNFLSFTRAVRNRNWTGAANQSNRYQLFDERNQFVYDLLVEAQQVEAAKEEE